MNVPVGRTPATGGVVDDLDVNRNASTLVSVHEGQLTISSLASLSGPVVETTLLHPAHPVIQFGWAVAVAADAPVVAVHAFNLTHRFVCTARFNGTMWRLDPGIVLGLSPVDASQPSGHPNEMQGWELALDAAGRTLAVAAPSSYTNQYSGWVYVFVDDAPPGSPEPAWRQSAVLTSGGALIGNVLQFGASLAMTPDAQTIIVGAPLYLNLGAVYVFGRTGPGTYMQIVRLSSSNSDFGATRVAISADGAAIASRSVNNLVYRYVRVVGPPHYVEDVMLMCSSAGAPKCDGDVAMAPVGGEDIFVGESTASESGETYRFRFVGGLWVGSKLPRSGLTEFRYVGSGGRIALSGTGRLLYVTNANPRLLTDPGRRQLEGAGSRTARALTSRAVDDVVDDRDDALAASSRRELGGKYLSGMTYVPDCV